MQQKQFILEWIDALGKMTPARMGGKTFIASDGKSYIFPSEGSRLLRKLREERILASKPDDKDKKFEMFYRCENGVHEWIEKNPRNFEAYQKDMEKVDKKLDALFEVPQRKQSDSLSGNKL
jgi:hypothetical protein